MQRVILTVGTFIISLNCCFAQTQIKVGNLSYAVEKNTTPSRLPPVAIAPKNGSNFNVRFPGDKYLETVNGSAFEPGWLSQRDTGTGVITITSPRGYSYLFDNGNEPNNQAGMELKLTQIKDPNGDSEGIYDYNNTTGLLDKVKEKNDANSVYMQFSYNTGGRLESITTVDPSVSSSSPNYSRTYSLVYDANDRVVSTTSSGGGCGCSGISEDWLVDVYDSNGQLIEQKDSTGQTIYTYSYHPNGSLREKKGKYGDLIQKIEFADVINGTKTLKVYDYVDIYNYRYSEKLIDVNAGGSIKSEAVFKELRDTRVNPSLYDTICYTTRYLYRYQSGEEYETAIPDGGDPCGNGVRTERRYNDNHNLISEIQYDRNNVPRQIVDNCYSDDKLDSTEDIRGVETEYYYDNYYSPLLIYQYTFNPNYNPYWPSFCFFHDAIGSYCYHYYYDNQNRKITEELWQSDYYGDSLVRTTHFDYDKYGNICKQYFNGILDRSNSESSVTDYVYNAFGNLVWQISPEGVVAGKTYDGAGRIENEFVLAGGIAAYNQITNPLDFNINNLQVISQTKYKYSSVYGKVEDVNSAIDNNAFTFDNPQQWTTTHYTYDTYGRKFSETKDYLGINLTTTYQYNARDEVETVTLPGGKWTKTERDGRGLTKRKLVGNGSTIVAVTQFKYDANGNLTEETTPDGSRTKQEYDDFNRVKRVIRGL